MGPDGLHLRELRGLVDALTMLLSATFEKSQRSEEVNLAPIFRKGQQGDLGNYERDSLT